MFNSLDQLNDEQSASSQAYECRIHRNPASTGKLGTTTVQKAADPVTSDPSPIEKTLPSAPDFVAGTTEDADTLDVSYSGQTPSSARALFRGMPGTPEVSPDERRPSSAYELSVQSQSPAEQTLPPEPELLMPPPVQQQGRASGAYKWVADSLAGRCSKTRTALAWGTVALVGIGSIASGVGLALWGTGAFVAGAWAAYVVSASVVTGLTTVAAGASGYRYGGRYEREAGPDLSSVIDKTFSDEDRALAEHVLKVHHEHFPSPLPKDPKLSTGKSPHAYDDRANHTPPHASKEVIDNFRQVKNGFESDPTSAEWDAKFYLKQALHNITTKSGVDRLCESAAEVTFQRYTHMVCMDKHGFAADSLRNGRDSLLENTAQAALKSPEAKQLQEQLPDVLGPKSDFCHLYSGLLTLADQNKGNVYGRALADVADTLRATILQVGAASGAKKAIQIRKGPMSVQQVTVEGRLDAIEREARGASVSKASREAIRRHLPRLVTARAMLEPPTSAG